MTTEEVIQALSRISERYETNQVFFTTDSPDGIIRPKNSLEIYVANNGHMSYGGLALFMRDVDNALGRDADYSTLNNSVPDSFIDQRSGILAYSGQGSQDESI